MNYPQDYQESNNGWRRIIGPVLAFFITVYFSYHIFQGKRGVISWFVLSKKVKQEEQTLSQLNQQKEAIERRVILLRPESIDLDILEELARKLLNYAREDEVIIYEKKQKTPYISDPTKGTLS